MKNITELLTPYTNNASLKLRYMSVQKFHEGHSRAAIAKMLNNKQKSQLKEYVIAHAVKKQGGRLMGKDIQKTYGVTYHIRNIYRLMKELGLVWITSRSKHPKQDLDAQEVFKKTLN
ncbi:winged helix-turn-helix domain-containing protein [Psychromonas aquimarina]|uniref:winged helix-turn-helix domain-containing protein n=1 Tax=Psychromonas aquimarina TaxID=444919 RepID=UPI000688B9B6|nr:winged helix-turn-helix domain-containing protein [Psychromonas aquimarina]